MRMLDDINGIRVFWHGNFIVMGIMPLMMAPFCLQHQNSISIWLQQNMKQPKEPQDRWGREGGGAWVTCYVGSLWESMGIFSWGSIILIQFCQHNFFSKVCIIPPQNMSVLPIDFHATAVPNNIGRAMSCFTMCTSIKRMSTKFHFVIPSHVSWITCLNL